MDTKRIENLHVPQGTTFRYAWPLAGVEEFGTTFLAQVRDANGSKLADLNVTYEVIDEVPHALLEITPEESSTWTFREGVYDILVTVDGGVKTRLLGGTFSVSPAVSHAD